MDVVNNFITKMKANNANKKSETKLYNDFFVQSPYQISDDNFDRIFDFFQQRTVRQDIYLEGFDKKSSIIRIRCFGIK